MTNFTITLDSSSHPTKRINAAAVRWDSDDNVVTLTNENGDTIAWFPVISVLAITKDPEPTA